VLFKIHIIDKHFNTFFSWQKSSKYHSHNCLLNYDLHRRNIVNSPNCACGIKEDVHVYHVFFVSKPFSSLRNVIFDELLKIQELSIIDTRTLLWGDYNLGYEINCKIFSTVQKFISKSERFSRM
jgi:hypothetical protein